MIKILLYASVLSFLLPANTFAQIESQKAQLLLENVVILNGSLDQRSLILPRVINDELWALYNEVQTEDTTTSYFLLYNSDKGRAFKLTLPLEKSYRKHIREFFVRDSTIILVDLVSVMVFIPTNDSSWKLTTDYDLPFTVYNASRNDSSLHFWNDLFNPFCGEKSCFYSYSLDLLDGTLSNLIEFPEPEGAPFMYIQPRNVLDCIAKTTVLSDVTAYSIRVYDTNDTIIERTISREPKNWVRVIDPVAIPEGSAPQALFPKLLDKRNAVSLIHRVELLDDSTLFVVWSVPIEFEGDKRAEYYGDIWRKADKQWRLHTKDMLLKAPDTDGQYSLHNGFLSPGFWYTNGVFLDVVVFPLDHKFDFQWPSYADYKKQCDRYFAENPLQYIVTIRTLEL